MIDMTPSRLLREPRFLYAEVRRAKDELTWERVCKHFNGTLAFPEDYESLPLAYVVEENVDAIFRLLQTDLWDEFSHEEKSRVFRVNPPYRSMMGSDVVVLRYTNLSRVVYCDTGGWRDMV